MKSKLFRRISFCLIILASGALCTCGYSVMEEHQRVKAILESDPTLTVDRLEETLSVDGKVVRFKESSEIMPLPIGQKYFFTRLEVYDLLWGRTTKPGIQLRVWASDRQSPIIRYEFSQVGSGLDR